MVRFCGGIGQTRGNVLRFQIRIIRQNFRFGHPRRQQIKNVFHPNPHSSDARTSSALIRIEGDPVCHGCNLRQGGTRVKSHNGRSGGQRVAAEALGKIASTIHEHPDSPAGQQLRRFVWSIFNQHHAVNLWRMNDELPPQQKGWVAVVTIAWMDVQVPEDSIRSALVDSGEMDRWDTVRLLAPEQRRLVDAIDAVSDILKSTPPGTASPAITRVDRLLRDVLDLLRTVRKTGG